MAKRAPMLNKLLQPQKTLQMLALFGCAVPDCVTAIVSDAPAEVDTRETVRANSRAQLSDLFEDEAPPRLQRNARTGSTRRIKKKKKHALARTVKHAVEEKAAEDGAASESLGKALWLIRHNVHGAKQNSMPNPTCLSN